ncbi:MAG: AAA family ATPase [Candidatus Ancillula sp.]|jgi:chromosome segregation protein|nr:AAA family ATPase [Candidatus Ancillula sp.]
MYLKNLTLRGFKSFASKTQLILEPGITCIVGPNGSGKSNVVDALSWVMGEQGAKTLRGNKMDDVIFAGSDGKTTALGRAEVSLTIDNSDGALPIEYTEVTIKRTMYRGGGSEYEINGESCRLVDIQELLSDTGLGRQMHVIVGQGRLDRILNATPMDRRGFIEEAAGVLKHRQRKEKAVRKLDSMKGNLDRLNDLIFEVRRQLGPLGRQANVAKRANSIQADLKDSLCRILADDLQQLYSVKQNSAKIVDELRRKRGELGVEVKNVESGITKLEQQLTSKSVQEITDKIHRLDSLQQRFESLISLSIQRQNFLSESSLLYEGQDPEKLLKSAEKARLEQETFEAELNSLAKKVDDAKTALTKADEDAKVKAHQVQIITQTANEKQTEMAKIETQIDANKKLMANSNENLKNDKEHLNRIMFEVQEFTKDIATVEKELQKLKKHGEIVEAELENAEVFEMKNSADLESAQRVLNDKMQKTATISGTIDTLKGLLQQQLGEDVVLKNRKLKTATSIQHLRKVKDSVAELCKEVGSDFALASSEKLANLLAETASDFSVLNLDGELLYHEKKNANNASNDVKKSIREQIREAETELEHESKDVVKLKKDLEKKLQSVEKSQEASKVARQRLNEHRMGAQQVDHKRQILLSQMNQIDVEKKRLENQIESTTERITAAESSELVLREQFKQLQNSEDNQQSVEDAVELAAVADVKLEEARSKFQDLYNDLAVKKTQNEELKKRFSELKQQAEAEEKARKDALEHEKAQKVKLNKAKEVETLAQTVLKYIFDSYAAAVNVKNELIAAQTDSNEQLLKARQVLKLTASELHKVSDKLHNTELESVAIDSKIENLHERILNEVYLQPAELLREFNASVPVKKIDPNDNTKIVEVPFNRKEQEARHAKAVSDLRALGKVNPLAMEEFEALEERYKHLSSQLEDVEKGRKDLLEMISTIDDKTVSSFKAAFDDTAAEFEKVFATLFPGGKGHLKLVDENDLLNTGIEIQATPAGKRISRLSLLSGGERSLVAVAMLVAIFKARPSPFYVMDEVEAALDDVNLSRLLKIFRDLKSSSQLLIITHQKRTMEVADSLYGITMRNDGVTQVISQKL